MKIALYSSAQDALPRVVDVSWQDLVGKLTTHRRTTCNPACPRCGPLGVPASKCSCPAKNGPAWSPVDIVDRRLSEKVRSVTAGVFDLDHVDASDESWLDRLERSGLAYVIHSTHSHTDEHPSLRLVLRFNRPVLPREWPGVRVAIVRDLQLPADPATKDLSRLYYLPDAPEGTEPVAVDVEGSSVDIDGLMTSARTGLPAAVPAAAPAPSVSLPVDLQALADLLKTHSKAEHRALVGRALRGEPLSPPRSGPYGGQDNELQALMSTAAFVLPNDTPDAPVIALMRPCFVATEWQDGQAHLEQEALKKFHRARERKVKRDAERLAENQAITSLLGIGREAAQTGTGTTIVDEGDEDPDAWAGALLTKDGRPLSDLQTSDEVRLLNCEANVELVLRASPEWRGVLRFNEVKKDIEVDGGPVVADPDSLDSEVAVWFQRSSWGRLGLRPKPSVVRDLLKSVAGRNRYNPVADYLRALVWDGTPRIDTWLETYLGAKDDPAYLRAVGPKWLISAVARALRPGSKVDTAIFLEGLQGLGKSTAFSILGGAWFCDASFDIRNKDSAALASQFWILEFAELKDVRKTDVDELKAFLSRCEDTYRPPYGRVNVRNPRRCVFAGTTNSSAYLKHDPSGYRRMWPVACERVQVEQIRSDRDQIWAEAVVRFEQGERWWLVTDEEVELARKATETRAEDTGGPDQMILEWVVRQPPEKRRGLTTDFVAMEALKLEASRVTTAIRMDIGRAMKRLQFKRVQRYVAGVPFWAYDAPDEIGAAPTTAPGGRPSPVSVVKVG